MFVMTGRAGMELPFRGDSPAKFRQQVAAFSFGVVENDKAARLILTRQIDLLNDPIYAGRR